MSAKLLSAEQLALIKANVRLRHSAFLVELLGDQAVSPRVLRQIRRAGLYKAAPRDPVQTAYTFGRFAIRDPRVQTMSPKEFDAYLKGHSLYLDPVAQKAIAAQKRVLATHVKALGDTLADKIQQAVAKAEKGLARALGSRRLPMAQAVLAREEAAQGLVTSMQDVTRQQLAMAQRVIETETNNAYQRGRAHEVQAKSPHSDPWVFKRPRADACPECKAAYLKADGKTPKLFRLSALSANGTNVGKSRGDRRPVVDSLHPFCRCEMSLLPDGFGFNAAGSMVYLGQKGAANG